MTKAVIPEAAPLAGALVRRRGGRRSAVGQLVPLVGPVILVVLWQLASGPLIDPFLLPSPTSVAQGLLELWSDGTLQEATVVSLGRILAGWLVGAAFGIPIGLLVGYYRVARQLIDPFIHFFRFVPAISLITLFILWLGVGEASKIGLIAYATGFIVLVNTATGVGAIPADKLNAARILGASPRQVFLWVVAPATVPYIFTGMRLAMATAFVVIVGAEIIAANAGLGYLVWTSRLYFRVDWIFGGVIVIGVLGYATDRLWGWIGRHAFGRFLRHSINY
ncbi:MAG TPA: ABC transporter permease [Candidatus Binatia bacterium]|nr:ABC transporter permease [Candidatus Binatia bacterium]